jgi:AcrR family transcriptional regulator
LSRAKTTTKRERLSRARILEVALCVVDEKGVHALKMRELGRTLGVEGMALYRHFSNKDEILDAMLDSVLAETVTSAGPGDWLEAVRRSAISVHRALERHPWAIELLMDPTRIRPARLEHIEALLARLEEAGFSHEETYHAYHLLDAYVYGFSLWLAGHSFTTARTLAAVERVREMITFADYPHLAKHHEQHHIEGRHREVSAFEIGLDLIMEGLAKKVPTDVGTRA